MGAVHAAALSFHAAVEATGGTLLPAPERPAEGFRGLSIDSRDVPPGAAFVAIRGERFDGHDYAAAAAEHAALVVLEKPPANPLPAAVLLVEDTTRALGHLARGWLEVVRPRVVGITGSVGKTTTKELTRSILARVAPTHATPGNFNNHIGLPLTLLSMPETTRFLIAEMGMNAPGEIAYLASLARPEVAAITAIAPVHLEGLGSVEAIAGAKAEIWGSLGEGVAVAPEGEALLESALARCQARCTFGEEEGTVVRILEAEPRGVEGYTVRLEVAGETLHVDLPLVGAHNVHNAACAAAIAHSLGIAPETIGAGLSQTPDLGHRSSIESVGPWQLLDDCYNASPKAMEAALDTLVQLAAGQPAYALLGRMLELGDAEATLHRQVGAHAATLPLSGLITAGAHAAEIARGARDAGLQDARIHEVETPEDAGALAAELAGRGSAWLLLKGSRGAHMERALAVLQKGPKS